jgi:hypothetical protein
MFSSPISVTVCTYTGPCYRGSATMSITGSCFHCPYHRDNRIQTYYEPKHVEHVEHVEKAKVKAKQLRDGLKNLPGNRKSMRY